MSKEAVIIKAQAERITQLRQELAAVPPAVPPAFIKDSADLAVEALYDDNGALLPAANPA